MDETVTIILSILLGLGLGFLFAVLITPPPPRTESCSDFGWVSLKINDKYVDICGEKDKDA